jgi:RNAse (barnase) inhibitor barstar
MRVYIIDGDQVSTLEQFAEHFSDRVLTRGHRWNGNLDALNDILRGGFGTPQEGFSLVWRASSQSRISLGYDETVRQLELRLQRCDPSNRDAVRDPF